MKIYLIRHAEPAYPADALTARGHRQARALARRLLALGVDAIYSSPMGRARATADHAAELLDLPVQVEPWMQELESWTVDQPPWGESPALEVDPRTVRRQGIDRSDRPLPPLDDPRLSAALTALERSSDAFLRRRGYVRDGALYRIERPSSERLAAVCHCGFGLTWLAHLLAIPPPRVWAGFTLAPSSVTTLAFETAEDGSAVPRCLGLGDLSHLGDDTSHHDLA